MTKVHWINQKRHTYEKEHIFKNKFILRILFKSTANPRNIWSRFSLASEDNLKNCVIL